MIVCPKCHVCSWEYVYRHPSNPDCDRFRCKSCGHEFKRYEESVQVIQPMCCVLCYWTAEMTMIAGVYGPFSTTEAAAEYARTESRRRPDLTWTATGLNPPCHNPS
jgi:hypothetical protein